jgi:hypothetical protein
MKPKVDALTALIEHGTNKHQKMSSKMTGLVDIGTEA